MNEEARTVLDLRLARGEISHEEYTKLLAVISQDTVEPPSHRVVGSNDRRDKRRFRGPFWVVLLALLTGLVVLVINAFQRHDAEMKHEIERGQEIMRRY
jgi:uncharacterized membrane protein